MNVIKYKNNFDKTKNIESTLMYGNMISDAEFTIAIPVYGLNKYFKDLLDNIELLESKSIKYQILVSDNKKYKSDEKIEILELLKKYNFNNLAYYLSNDTLGQLNNFNRAVLLSQTKFVSMIHDDDLLIINYLSVCEKTIRLMKYKNNIGMVHTCFETFSNNVRLETKSITRLKKISKYSISYYGMTQTGIPSCGVIFNRDIFLKCGGFNDDYPSSGDAFLAATMIDMKYDVYKFDQVIGYYRIGNNISLKLDICQNFIKEDDLFLESWYKKVFFMKLWLKIARRYLYSLNIDVKCRLFSPLNSDITVSNLDYKKKYKKYRKISFLNLFRIPFSILNKIIDFFMIKKI